jgi:hypothetical protein
MAALRLVSLSLLLLIGASPTSRAQGGYRSSEVPEVGLEYKSPRNYDAIPTEPTEEWIIAQWAEQIPKDAKKRKEIRPELRIVWIERAAPVPARTAAGDDPPPPPGDEEDEEEAKPAETPRSEVVDRINSTGRYLERFLRGWQTGDPEDDKERDGMRAQASALSHEKAGKRYGWIFEYSDDKRVCLFIGFCHEDDAKEQVKIWRTMARSARFVEPKPVDLARWERYYERNPQLIDPAYRLKVRSQLVRGWAADDTENYIFVFSTTDQKLLQIMKRELEAIREEYQQIFPPARPVTAVSTVRICKSLDEYHQYGGPKGSGGYWNSREQELVFFDYDSLDQAGKKKKGKANSRIVLYHEAFHQYIHYSTGELPPHSWYNEGTGDFFSGANIVGTKVRGIGVNPWRIALIQRGITGNQTVPWKDILRFEQAEFYRPDRRGMCYAQAWSLIYFLRESKAAQKHPVWSGIHASYFESLKAAYAEELAKAGIDPAGGEQDPTRRMAAGKAARERAVEQAFQDVDLDELDRAWRAFVLDLKVPR